MADLARALQTPVPATQPAPKPEMTNTQAAQYQSTEDDAQRRRDAKNKRDQERRKAQRAAHTKAVETALAKKKAAAPKKKRKAKKKVAAAPAPVRKKARGRGRPPGSKNKPKPPLMDTVFPVMKVPSVTAPNFTVTSANAPTTALSIVVAMARMTPMERAEALTAIRAAFFDA